MPHRILYPFAGDTIGGSHLSALELIRSLDRHAYEPVIGVHRQGPLTEHLTSQALDWAELPSVNTTALGGAALSEALEICRTAPPNAQFLKREKISLVHTNDRRMHGVWSIAARLGGIRHLVHRRTLANGFRDRLVDLMAETQVAISRATARHRPDSTAIIYNPIGDRGILADKQEYREWLQAALNSKSSYDVVVQVCNLTERKRPRTFVAVARRVLELHGEGVVFLIIGDQREPELSLLRQRIADLGMSDHVVLMGHQSPIEPWIAGSDVLVATAKDEGFGRTLVEAMLCGTPVVASADGGHLEIVQSGTNGVLVGLDDVEGYAKAIVRILEDKGWSESLSGHAYQSARERYSVKRHVLEVQALYARMLKR